MHCSLQMHLVAKWRHKFSVDNAIWESYQSENEYIKGTEVPKWFDWVTKWYLHCLNGPFGSVHSFMKQQYLFITK